MPELTPEQEAHVAEAHRKMDEAKRQIFESNEDKIGRAHV